MTASPSPTPATSPDRPPFQKIRWGWRIAGAVLIGIGVYLGMVGLPAYFIQLLQSHGVPISNWPNTLSIFGIVVAILAAAQFALKPTRVYGPVSVATSVAEILYVLQLFSTPPLHVNVGSDASLTIGYTLVVVVVLIVTLITLAANIVTTVEDLRYPDERLAWLYPRP